MAPVSLLDCPDEVVDDIVQRLPGSAVKVTRETCKRLNRIASPYLFPILYISCHQLDLDVFRMVSKNPLLIGGVRELVIDDTTVPPSVRDWPTYQKVVTFPEDASDRRDHFHRRSSPAKRPGSSSAAPPKVIMRTVWPTQTSTRSRGHFDDSRIFGASFSEGAQSSVSSSPVVKVWRRFETEVYLPLVPRCDWHPTTQGLQDRTPVNTMDWLDDRLVFDITKNGVSDLTAVESTYDLFVEQQGEEAFKQGRAEFLFDCDSSELFVLAREARAISLALLVLEDPKLQSQLTEFRVDATYDIQSSGHQPGLAITLFDQQSPFAARLGSGFSAATNITKLNLTLSNLPYGTDGDVIVEEGRFRRIFESMNQLEELYLEPHGMAIFSILPVDITFPRLRSVQFSCGHLHPKTLLDFVRRHGGTLKTLIAKHCSLRPYDEELQWRQVTDQLTEFNGQGILQLEEGFIDNVFQGKAIAGCGNDGTLEGLGQIWKYDDEDGKWVRWLDAQEEAVNEMLLSGAHRPDP
ncbi:hypothetical protein FBULB1_1461 [Fusarium bulbicola]|nr:hypothetical protein FBULB1_1461 [Fusarium bulbicola]